MKPTPSQPVGSVAVAERLPSPGALRRAMTGWRELSAPVDRKGNATIDHRFFAWGWLPLVVGSIVIAATILGVWELVASIFGYGHDNTTEKVIYMVRGGVTATFLALYAGWYVLRTRRQLEHIRARLLIEENELAERAWRLEQRAAAGAFSRTLAHEIRNPLNGVNLHCSLIERAAQGVPQGDARARIDGSLAVIRRENHRLEELVQEYLQLARGSEQRSQLESMDPAALVHEVVETHRPDLQAQGIAVTVEVEPVGSIRGNAGRLCQVVHNLLRNARDALADSGGQVWVRLFRHEHRVVLEAADDGPGFADPDAVFRPFYSTKECGTGMGMTIVRDVVRAHGGSVEAFSRKGGGAVVRIALPLERR